MTKEEKMAHADATLTIRTNKALKQEVGKILGQLGLTHSTAVNIFYSQVLAQRGIPFDVKIPNKETREALENSRKRKNLTTYKTSEELFEDLGI
jgi:DNA-damage-inducible protein J